MYDCVSVGSATQDVFVFSEGAQIHRLQSVDCERTYLAFDYGAKVKVEQLFVTVGGGAVNTSIALSRLGMRTGIVCEVGQDDAANAIRTCLDRAGVDTSMMVANPSIHTGYSVVITGFDGDRTVLVHRGASVDLERQEVPWERLSHSQWVYLGSMTDESAQLWDQTAAFACETGVKLAINPGSTQVKLGLEGLRPVLSATEVIFVNCEEAFRLTGVEETRGDDDEMEAMRRLHDAGCRLVVMTMGSRGARAFDGETAYYCPAPEVRVVSNLGAGDAFASGCLAALHRGRGVQIALMAGAANAAGVVTTMGATEGQRTWAEVAADIGISPE